jgi:hypothetical protein
MERGMRSWSTEELSIAFDMFNEGFSSTLIANRLGRTRNAVIGMINRETLKNPLRRTLPPKPLNQNKKIPKPRVPKYRKNHININVSYNFHAVKLEPVIETTYASKTIMHLRMFDCRAILGDVKGENTMYCAAPVADNSSWCPAHKKLFTTKPNS